MVRSFTRSLPFVGGVCLALILASADAAAPLTFAHQGPIDGISVELQQELGGLLDQDLRVEYTFDPRTQDSDPSPERGSFFDPNGSLNVRAGTLQYTALGLHLQVEETPEGDIFSLAQFVIGDAFPAAAKALFGLTFFDDTGQAFKGDSLPLAPPSPAQFSNVGMGLGFCCADDNDDFDIIGFAPINGWPPRDDSDFVFTVQDDSDILISRLDEGLLRTTQVQTVPEPVTVASAAIALAGASILLIRRRLVSEG